MDLLIDFATRHAMFSFMDRFSGYNQIWMAPRDVKKTTFRMPIKNFYYTVMPFELKIVGVTFQCTMTMIFHDMMHCEMKGYVDNIVVKSRKWEDHIKVLKKVFEMCNLFKLRMNSLKCAFGVSTEKFLGFLVHSRGIDVDLTKTVAIATMKPLTIVKELKRFLGKVSHIKRFVLGLASIILAFTRLLKKG